MGAEHRRQRNALSHAGLLQRDAPQRSARPAGRKSDWTWTGTWRDPRFSPPADGGKPENALTGTIFEVDAFRVGRDPGSLCDEPVALLAQHANVAQSHGATTTLTQNILGYEWDASPDNGFAPAGLIYLSSTTLNVSTFLRRLRDSGR